MRRHVADPLGDVISLGPTEPVVSGIAILSYATFKAAGRGVQPPGRPVVIHRCPERLNLLGGDQVLLVVPAALDYDEFRPGKPQGYNRAASGIGLRFFPNMRVPAGTPIAQAFQGGGTQDGSERLDEWVTSRGERLTSLDAHTSARRIGPGVYALVSV